MWVFQLLNVLDITPWFVQITCCGSNRQWSCSTTHISPFLTLFWLLYHFSIVRACMFNIQAGHLVSTFILILFAKIFPVLPWCAEVGPQGVFSIITHRNNIPRIFLFKSICFYFYMWKTIYSLFREATCRFFSTFPWH